MSRTFDLARPAVRGREPASGAGAARGVLALCAALALAQALAGCAALQPAPAASQEEQREYAAAIADRDRDPARAAARLEDFIARYPDSPLADDAGETLAGIALAEGDAAEAKRWLLWVEANHPGGDRADAARVRLARLEADEGNPLVAREILDERVRWSRLSDPEKRQGYRTRVELSDGGVETLRWLAALREVTPPDEQAAVDAEIDALLAVLTTEQLEQAADQVRDGDPGARVRVRLGERALEAGDIERARKEARRARRPDVSETTAAAIDALDMRIEVQARFASGTGVLPSFAEVASRPAPTTDGAVGTIGVVLPLTGDFARYGEASLRGVLLAAGIFGPVEGIEIEGRPEPTAVPPAVSSPGREPARAPVALRPAAGEPARVRVLVRDSGGSPERAARAVRDLAARDDVVAIVGPLLSRSAEAAARVAEEEGVPLLTLTSRDEVARERSQVFRLRMRPEDEVEALAEHAMGPLGARRFAILYPRDAYGRGVRKLFWRAVERRGGEVVAVAGYDREDTDFAKPIRRLVGYELLTADERRALAKREKELQQLRRLPPEEQLEKREEIYARPGPEGQALPPIVDFDALFIPDSHDKIVLIAPQLVFHEVDGVRLLGPDGWDHPDLVRMEGRHVRGAVVATPFYPASPFPFVQDFVRRYEGAYGTPPDAFAACAFDAANLALVQLAYGSEDRRALREGVLRTHAYPGVSGVTTVLPDGNAHKRPFLLEVDHDTFTPVD